MAAPTVPRLATGRRFGLEIGGACLALAAYLAWRGTLPPLPTALAAAGAALVAIAVARPSALTPVARRWQMVGERLAAVTTPVILTVIYLVVVTPLGVLRRTFSRSPIHRDPAAPSHWVRRPPSTPEARRSAMEHQF